MGWGPLHVGVPGHDGDGVPLRFFAQHRYKVLQLGLDGGAVLAQGQAHIQGHLVVAAAGGVQALARVADAGGQFPLHKGVDVLGVGVDGESAGVQVRQDGFEARDDLLAFAFVDDAALPSMVAWAMLPWMSSWYILLSMEMLELKSLVLGSASFWKRPFHSFMEPRPFLTKCCFPRRSISKTRSGSPPPGERAPRGKAPRFWPWHPAPPE